MSDASRSDDRARILADVRAARVPDPGLPDLVATDSAGNDRARQFAQALRAAGGTCIAVPDASEATAAVRALPGFDTARRVVSELSALPSRHPGAPPKDPQDLADLDFALLRGLLGVAESGAVWLEPANVLLRAAAFLASEVVLVVSHSDLVADLHEAYARIELGAAGFGCFVAGPSKTADIEQSLVIGAHGPRTLSVFLVEDAGDPRS